MERNEDQGFRQIGNLTPTAEQLRKPRDTETARLKGSLIVSGTFGQASPDNAASSSIGPRRGETTSVAILPGVRLADQHPVAVDRWAKEQLPPRVASLIATAEILNNDYNISGYRPIALSDDDAALVVGILDGLCRPLPYEETLKWLALQRAQTKRRTAHGDDEEMTLAAYEAIFEKWPADVAMIVLQGLHKIDKGWWPDAYTVEKALEWYGSGRVKLLEAARARLDGRGTVADA